MAWRSLRVRLYYRKGHLLRRHIKSHLSLMMILLALAGPAIADEVFECVRVVDGDTIVVKVNNRNEKVRLIGVDTPETVHPSKPVQYFGKEASEFTRSIVEGKKVRLEYDWQKRDKYRRLLAYVFLQDGTFLNAEIIKRGYGFAYVRYPFRYMEEFKGYESEARTNRLGLWK